MQSGGLLSTDNTHAPVGGVGCARPGLPISVEWLQTNTSSPVTSNQYWCNSEERRDRRGRRNITDVARSLAGFMHQTRVSVNDIVNPHCIRTVSNIAKRQRTRRNNRHASENNDNGRPPALLSIPQTKGSDRPTTSRPESKVSLIVCALSACTACHVAGTVSKRPNVSLNFFSPSDR